MNNIEEITKDIEKGEEILKNITGDIVTIFGSARLDENSYYYHEAFKLAQQLAKKGYNILTGGGPGIMEAGNRGAFSEKNSKIHSIGFNILLPKEQKINPYVSLGYTFHQLYTRKALLIKYSKIFVVFPGGYGTLDELFEIAVLVQTKQLNAKIYLFGKDFYQPLMDFLENSLAKDKMISQEDLKLLSLVDSIDEILQEC